MESRRLLLSVSHRSAVCIGLLLLQIGSTPGLAQNVDAPPDKPTTASISTERLDELSQQASAAEGLDDELRTRLLETYKSAADALSRAAEFAKAAEADEAAVESVEERTAALEKQLSVPVTSDLSDVSGAPPLAELEAAVARRQAQLQEAQTALTDAESIPAARNERRRQLAAISTALANRRTELEEQLTAAAAPGESSLLTTATRTLAQARLQELFAEGPAHQWELARFDSEKAAELPGLRIQLARRTVSRLEEEVAVLNGRINALRSREARTSAIELRAFAAEVTGADLRLQAERTADLADANEELAADLAAATQALDAARDRLEEITSADARTRNRVNRVGLTGGIGLKLRDELKRLPALSTARRETRVTQERMRDIEFQRIEYEDARRALGDAPATSSDEETRIHSDRAEVLDTLKHTCDTFFDRLSDLEGVQQETVRATASFRDYIDERVLWIRSNPSLGVSDTPGVVRDTRLLLSAAGWQSVGADLGRDLRQRGLLYVLAALLFVTALSTRRSCRGQLASLGRQAAKPLVTTFDPTLRAALLTVVLSVAWPVMCLFVGWRLYTPTACTDFSKAIGQALLTAGTSFLLFNMLRMACRPNGLGAHFGWPKAAMDEFRDRLARLMVIVLPLMFIVVALRTHSRLLNSTRDSPLERLGFIGFQLVFAVFFYRVLHPRVGVFRSWLAFHPDSWMLRFRGVWFFAIVAMPLCLAGLAAVGFFYTAVQLDARLQHMVWLLAGILFLYAFLMRWFMVNHRRLRIEQARQRRAALLESAAMDADHPPDLPPMLEENEAELAVVSEQTRRLIRSGLALAGILGVWMIWSDVVPAVHILDSWELWSTTATETRQQMQPDGQLELIPETVTRAVTPVHLLLATILTVATFTLARNIPGLVEIILLQRLPLEPAIRYAIRMVTRYAIIAVGVVSVFSVMGIGWSEVQWLAAGLTVGLGFGLQEIFANFISGIIVLFERPVRIGDVVTIDGVSGRVSRIQMRATTIMDWDRREYIVPNKDFVTGRLLNWTLSDNTSRIVINVGVAYGTSVDAARNLLIRVASDHPLVLDEPAPLATLEGFGDSTLDLVLRCYMPSLDNRLTTISELHEQIDSAFTQAGIEIAFPQQDLNLRSVPESMRPS